MMEEETSLCKHNHTNPSNNTSFCYSCGSITISNRSSIRPLSLIHVVEINPMLIYQNMLLNSTFTQKYQNKHYLHKRPDIIQNLFNITRKLRFCKQTFYLSIFYLDYIVFSLNSDIKFELLALCCLIVAAKFDENDPIIPDYKELQNIYNKMMFSLESIRKYEFLCLKALGPTHHNKGLVRKKSNSTIPCVNINISTKSILFVEKNECLVSDLSQNLIEKIYELASEILFYIVDDNIYLTNSQIHIACSCIALTREIYKFSEIWPEALELTFSIKSEDFKKCLETVKVMLSKKKIANPDISTYFTQRQLQSSGTAITPTLPPSVPRKHHESSKLSAQVITTPIFKKKNTLAVIKAHSTKYSIELLKDNKGQKQSNTQEKDSEEKSKKAHLQKPVCISLALKKVYNSNNSDKSNNSDFERKGNKKKTTNYSSNQLLKISAIINEYKSNDTKRYNSNNLQRNNKINKLTRKNDPSKNKDNSLANISIGQANTHSGGLTQRSAKFDANDYYSNGKINSSKKIRPQLTSRNKTRKISFNKFDVSGHQEKKSTSTQRDGNNYNKIPKSFKIDLNDIGSEAISSKRNKIKK